MTMDRPRRKSTAVETTNVASSSSSSSSVSTSTTPTTVNKKCRARWPDQQEGWCKGCKGKQRCTMFPSLDPVIKKRRCVKSAIVPSKFSETASKSKTDIKESLQKGDNKVAKRKARKPATDVKRILKNHTLKELISKEKFAQLPLEAQRELASLLPYCDSGSKKSDENHPSVELPFSALKNEYLTAFFDSYKEELDYGWLSKHGSDVVDYDKLSKYLPQFFDQIKLEDFEGFFMNEFTRLRLAESAIWDGDDTANGPSLRVRIVDDDRRTRPEPISQTTPMRKRRGRHSKSAYSTPTEAMMKSGQVISLKETKNSD